MGQIVLHKLHFYIMHFSESRKRTILLKTHHNSSKIRLAHYPLPLEVDKGLEISIVQSVWRVKHLFSASNDFRTTCAHLQTVRISSILPYQASFVHQFASCTRGLPIKPLLSVEEAQGIIEVRLCVGLAD